MRSARRAFEEKVMFMEMIDEARAKGWYKYPDQEK